MVELTEMKDLADKHLVSGGRSVLVVEDDLELSTVMDRILKSIDPELQLSWATSAEEALGVLRAAARLQSRMPFDLIIADVFLEGERTGMDLWRFCHREYPLIPWVVTSGTGLEGIQPNPGRDAERPLFLRKPFAIAEARQLFQRLLDPDRGPAASGETGRSAPPWGGRPRIAP